MRAHQLKLLAVSFVLTLLPIASRLWGDPSPSRRSAIVQAVADAKGAIVNIQSERLAKAGGPADDFRDSSKISRSNGMGTGIIIDSRGYIVTNCHVIEEVTALRVRLHDGSSFTARVAARDKEADLALLKIDVEHPLPTIKMGISSDLMVGETVIAVGNAFGYEHTVTVGVISALHRDVTLNKEISYKHLIQTDASINPGNSGGPLLNIDGELVGVNVAIRAGAQGIGFAIPVDQVVQCSADLLARKRRSDVTMGLIGRNCVDARHTPPRYLEVDRVDANGAAAKAGVKSGDVVVRVGELAVNSTMDLERALLDIKPGDKLPVLVRRGGTEQQCELTLAAPKPLTTSDLAWKQFGFRVAPSTADLSSVSSNLRGGLLLSEVNPESAAGKAGLQAGDVLVGLHLWETSTMENLSYVVKHPDLNSFYPMRFYVVRSGQMHKGYLSAE
jgi:serine protease Do